MVSGNLSSNLDKLFLSGTAELAESGWWKLKVGRHICFFPFVFFNKKKMGILYQILLIFKKNWIRFLFVNSAAVFKNHYVR